MLGFARFKTLISLISRETVSNNWSRTIVTGNPSLCEVEESITPGEKESFKNIEYKKIYPLSECLEYMNSEAYKTTYGKNPVWHVYVRNFKGALPPETRHTCLTSKGEIITGSPCPICRDKYLLVHYKNVKLLEQFVSPFGGEILPTKKTGVCQRQQFNLKVAIKKAQNYGLLSFTIPHRHYDYSLYYKK